MLTENKALVNVGALPAEVVFPLKAAIEREFVKSGIDLAKLKNDASALTFIPLVLAADSSPEVHDALFNCLARCTYNSEKITIDTFNDIKAREDYYDIIAELLTVNIWPFFKRAFSRFTSLVTLANLSAQNSQKPE